MAYARAGMLLVDSGAMHEVRSVCSEEELPADCQRVQLQLAVGETAAWMSGEDIVYVVVQKPEEKLQPLFPLGAYIRECNLTLDWSKDACMLRSPEGACSRWMESMTAVPTSARRPWTGSEG